MRLTGHVEKRRKNSWLLVVEFPPDESGRRKRVTHSVKVDTKKEANAELRRWLTNLEETQVLPSKSTLADWLDRWMRDYVIPRRAPKTVVGYRNCIQHVLPALGNKGLQELSAADVQEWLTILREAGRIGPRTQEYAFAVLRKALNDAVRLGLLAYNPCLRCDPPKPQRPQARAIPLGELELLIASAPKEVSLLILAAALTGLRLGELLGLRWEDVNLDEGWLQVAQAVQVVERKYVIRAPKADSRRRIALPPPLVTEFKEHKKEQAAKRLKAGPAGKDLDLVFCRTDGYYLNPSTAYHRMVRWYKRILGKHYRPHDLRHTHATLLLSQGTHPRVVQSRLGHSQIAVTMNTYSHVLPSMDREAADSLGRLLTDKTGHERQPGKR